MSIKSIENLEVAIKKAEHLLLVLKRMKDDPQGDTGGLYATPEAALHARCQQYRRGERR